MDDMATRRACGIWRPCLVCVAAAGMWLAPIGAAAQEDAFTLEMDEETRPSDPEAVRELTEVRSEVEVGIGSVSRDSYRFGRYTGLEAQGAFGVLDLDIRRRGAYDGDDARYWNFNGSNLGLTSRDARFEYGVQGRYGIVLEYDWTPTFRSDTAQTIFDGAGSTNLTLPTPWTFGPDGADPGTVAGDTTGEMADLNASLRDVNIDHERRRLGVGFEKRFSETWRFTTRFTHETKDGLKTVGAVIGNSGGNPRAVLIPEPIDYVTRQFEAVLGYADRKAQFHLGYDLSFFNDRNDSLTWENPYAAITGWDSSAGYPAGEGRLHLPPDNQFHQVSAGGGYNLTERTRVTADLALGRMIQDQEFLPYTVNPALAASITQPLPRNSLDGWIDTTLLNVRIASRPTPKLSVNAGYRYDDRDNKTPRDEYVYIGGDSQTQDTSVASSRRRFNEPYSYQEHQLKLDAGYRFFRRMDLTAGVERKETERTYSEREDATEDTYRLGLKNRMAERIETGVRLSRADRHGATYRGDEPFLSSYDPGYTSAVPGSWENHPDLRKYFLADRRRDLVAVFATLAPSETWTVGVNGSYLVDDYERSEMGLTGSTIKNYTVDAGYRPTDAVTTHAFYAYENLRSEQDGRSVRGTNRLGDAADPTRDWFADHRDRVDTVGAGVTTVIADRLDLGADYVYARSKSAVNVTAGSSLTTAPLPTSITRLNSLAVHGTYRLRRDMSLKVRYRMETFTSTDWAVDNIEPDTLANVVTLGEENPDDTVHVVAISFAYRF